MLYLLLEAFFENKVNFLREVKPSPVVMGTRKGYEDVVLELSSSRKEKLPF